MKKVVSFLIFSYFLLSISITASAHPGRTDSRGGHRDSSSGEYHYHHGYSAHDHYDMDGDGDLDCPYGFQDKTNNLKSTAQYSGSMQSKKSINPWNLISSLFRSIIPAFAISVMLLSIFANILFFFFGDDKGWTISKIVFILIFVILYYQLVKHNLS